MSSLDKEHESASSTVELSTIVVDKSENTERGSCWEYNVSEQFPIKSAPASSGFVVIEVDKPHEGYSIETTMKDSKMNGEATIRSDSNVLIAILNFVDGIASGPCTLYDNDGIVYFEGYFENGYREGRGKVYDENGELVFDGFYKEGKKLGIFPVKEMGEGYWKEVDENGNVTKISQKDESGKDNGFCYYYDKDHNWDRVCKWENGSEIAYTGPFKLFDEPHEIWFDGNFVNGYREGRGKEYNKKGEFVSDGYYKEGKKLGIILVKEMGKEYWKEVDENGNVTRISQKDEKGIINGMCYVYNEGKISQISEWANGEEIAVWKEFDGNVMTEYEDGNKVYKGGYLDSLELRYPRNGEGEEFDVDGKSRIFKGNYENGKRHGLGMHYVNGQPTKKEMFIFGFSNKQYWTIETLMLIVIILLIVISFFMNAVVGTCVTILLYVFLLVCWACPNCFGRNISPFIDNKVRTDIMLSENTSKSVNNKASEGRNKKCCTCFLVESFSILMCIILIVIGIGMAFSIYDIFYDGQHGIRKNDKSYLVKSGSYNYVFRFSLTRYPQLNNINIEDDCFASVETFTIDGLDRLMSIIIGKNSFTETKDGKGYSESKSFSISNCPSLLSISIGEYSFSDFGGQFELKNLPSLLSINVGTIGGQNMFSYNFYSSEFVISGRKWD